MNIINNIPKMENKKTICAVCGNKSISLRKNKELTYEFKNPGKVKICTDVYECDRCGEDYLGEKSMVKVAAELDKQRKKN